MDFNSQDDIDAYLDRILQSNTPSLAELFDKKLSELKIAKTTAFKLMGAHSTSMNGVLTGSKKLVDVRNLVKLANFLQLELEQVVGLYIKSVEKNSPVSNISAKEVNFIKENFDLAVLKKAGLIDTISDFDHIKKRIINRLGLKSILQYKKPDIDVAFCSGLFKPENNRTRAFWISSALASLSEINNPYPYDREGLIKLFPSIGWYSTDVEKGLLEVSKLLFKIGITVIYQPSLQTLKVNGATFNHNNKPAIVLCNHSGFYATLWHALIHELYHVLFDWSEIQIHKFHLTDDTNEQLSVQEREAEANRFAREYLFSSEKSEHIKPYLNDVRYVEEYGQANHVDPSIIYVYYAFDNQSTNRKAWGKARIFSPDINRCRKPVNWQWGGEEPVEEVIPQLAVESYTQH